MSLFRRKPAQRPMISWPVDRPLGDIQRLPTTAYPAVYSPIASSPSTDFSFASRWPLQDENDSQVTLSPSPLQMGEDISVILDVYPPPPPPPKDEPKVEVIDFARVDSSVEIHAPIDGKEQPIYESQSHEEGTPQRNTPTPSVFEDVAITPTGSPSLPVYEEEADIYRYLSRSPPMYKDDEDVYEDVYDNISPLRSTCSFANEAIRPRSYSNEDVEPVSPLRPNNRKFADQLYKDLLPLNSNPAYDEDLFEDEPLMSPSAYDEEDDLSPLPPALYSSYNSSPLSWRSNRTSDLTMSTVVTSYSNQNLRSLRSSDDMYASSSLRAQSNKSSCTDYDCSIDYEDYFEKIQHEIDISDARPNDDMLAQAGKIPIFDSDGKGRPFSSIYSGDTAIGEQQMVIFVRHFYCGACQAYLRALSKAIPFSTYFSLPKPTSITIIGLGSPELINTYRKRTNCPFPIYSDPTKRLYRALGMKWVLTPGKNPGYMKGISTKAWVMSQVDEMNNIDERLKYRGGHMLWVGGEFLFRDSEVVWCHRMKTYRGHAEIDVVKKILEVEEDS